MKYKDDLGREFECNIIKEKRPTKEYMMGYTSGGIPALTFSSYTVFCDDYTTTYYEEVYEQ